MKKIVIIGVVLLSGVILILSIDLITNPVKTIDDLIGQNFEYAHKVYFKSDPDNQYTININDGLNEFDGAILNKKDILTDSIIHVYTWTSLINKKTIWTANTKNKEDEIIDAIRYRFDVQF